jgi:small subunit ribosomal protein S6
VAANGTREYELVLMLDPEAPDERRDQIVADTRGRIEGGGTLKHDTAWGMRKLAYEIRQRTEADYRFFRFESGPPLLESLDHELKIADGVLRFRIFTVDPRTPMIVPPPPVPTAAGRPQRRGSEAPPAPAERAAAPRADGAEAAAAEPPQPEASAPEEAAPAEAQPDAEPQRQQ